MKNVTKKSKTIKINLAVFYKNKFGADIKPLITILLFSFCFSETLKFEYALIGKKSKKSKILFNIDSGDTLSNVYTKLNLKYYDANIYVILEDSNGEFLLLYKSLNKLGSLALDGVFIDLPWLDMMNYKNDIKIYLINSKNSLDELEQNIENYNRSNKRNKLRIKKSIAQLLDNYIFNKKIFDETALKSRLESQTMVGVTFRANTKKKIKEHSLVHLVEGQHDIISKTIELNFK